MARKKKHEEHENHERWLISYADFITLLFAFFVVMYSISAINEGKFRVLSEALVAAFRSQPKALEPIQVGKPLKGLSEPQPPINIPAPISAPANAPPTPPAPPPRSAEEDARIQRMQAIAEALEKAMLPLIKSDLVAVRRDELWLEVEIKASVLFPSGSATLQPQALPVLNKIADILKEHPNPIRIEGFTDNWPINTTAFPSNWELSSARSSSVVRLFTHKGIAPERLAAVGFGEHRPIGDNKTETGRRQNRRVVLVVLAYDDRRTIRQAPPAVTSQPAPEAAPQERAPPAAEVESPPQPAMQQTPEVPTGTPGVGTTPAS